MIKCILCQYWRRFSWRTERHTGQWIYQSRGEERRIIKGPKMGSEKPDLKWKDTGRWTSSD